MQANYCEFAKRYGQSYDNPLINEIEIPFMEKRISFILINSAWMSTKHEKAGSMCLPENLLPPYPIENADLSIVMMHHPYYWFHPDNAIIAEEYLRNIADIVLFGHEHRSDEKAVSGKGWSILQLNGKELQGDNPEKSAFAAYVFSKNSIRFEISNFSGIRSEDSILDQQMTADLFLEMHTACKNSLSQTKKRNCGLMIPVLLFNTLRKRMYPFQMSTVGQNWKRLVLIERQNMLV